MLGSTGSIGISTLDVIESLPGRLEVFGLSAHSRVKELLEQAKKHKAKFIAVSDAESAAKIGLSELPLGCQLLSGADAVIKLVQMAEVDMVVSAIVGAAGIEGTWAALEAGKPVGLANKETLVVAGPLVMELARKKVSQYCLLIASIALYFRPCKVGRKNRLRK